MGGLIDRDELKARLMEMTTFKLNSEIGDPTCGITRRVWFHMSEIMREVCDMPVIEERKTGNWRRDSGGYKCNQCGRIVKGYESYCPKCGARMRL